MVKWRRCEGTPPYEVRFHVLMPPIIVNFLRLMNFNPSVTASPCLLPKSEAICAQLFLTKKQEL